MRTHAVLLPLTFALCFAGARAADLDVREPWLRATGAPTVAGGFVELTSADGAALLGASSPVAAVVEIHEMKLDGGIMRMRRIPRLELPPGRSVLLSPGGGHHLMLMGLQRPLRVGERVPLVLRIEGRDGRQRSVEALFDVRPLTSAAPRRAP